MNQELIIMTLVHLYQYTTVLNHQSGGYLLVGVTVTLLIV